jgi:hypothetical protein
MSGCIIASILPYHQTDPLTHPNKVQDRWPLVTETKPTLTNKATPPPPPPPPPPPATKLVPLGAACPLGGWYAPHQMQNNTQAARHGDQATIRIALINKGSGTLTTISIK